MSDDVALVRFDDGTGLGAYFFGSVDAVMPLLVPLDELDDLLDEGMEGVMDRLDVQPGTPEDAEPVEVWTPVGYWPAKASKSARLLVTGLDPFGSTGGPPPDGDIQDGTPTWVPTEFASP